MDFVNTSGKKYRLPPEAEWEYAARAGTTSAFWWGNTSEAARGVFDFDKPYGGARPLRLGIAIPHPNPVGAFGTNPFGLADMAGNVGEWVEDCYHAGYSGAPASQEPWITGCGDKPTRLWRGGSFAHSATDMRPASRGQGYPDRRRNSVGFRVVRDF